MMRILVIGSGGREHALVRALERTASGPVEMVCAPGNAGISADARCVDVAVSDVAGLVELALRERPDLVVVGPEAPLVEGIVDELAAAGVRAFGPGRAAARLEGSKVFAKEVMLAAGVPTGGHAVVDSLDAAREALAGTPHPVVLKADGLAAGKGVIICADAAAVERALGEFFVERRFGNTPVVIEEFLNGEELSLLAICDGERALPMAPARDYKRIFDGDRGPNTGGMGSFSPVPGFDRERIDELSALVHQPIVDTMRERGTPFHGILYAGLMMTADGPRVLEYNCRLGDPETQAILPRLTSDLAALMTAATTAGGLAGATLTWSEETAVTITLASAGYPESSSSGDVISGLDRAAESGAEVTHAGTARGVNGGIATAGGRVLNVTALGPTVAAARDRAYAAAREIEFDGRQMRSDIASGVA